LRFQGGAQNSQLREIVGIFSLFGKKDSRQGKPADKESSRTKKQSGSSTSSSGSSSSSSKNPSTRVPTVKRDAKTALATALKIDAIESEMSSEFVNITTTQPGTTIQKKPAVQPAPAKPKSAPPAQDKPRADAKKHVSLEKSASTGSFPQVVVEMGTTTDFLLDGQSAIVDIAAPASDAEAMIEEAAIMYANGQTDLVEQMLKSAIEEDLLGDVTRNAWWMLFDLYQITGKKQEFENLSIDYASKFETSPPTWIASSRDATPAAAQGTTPMVPFSGKLDGTCVKQVERAQKLGENYRTLRLEFAKVTEATSEGCHLLLDLLKKLQKSEHDLILVGAPELADKIRAIIEVGRRDDTEDSWLLLLEILRLLNREKEFEETSIDYCVTFEVSPPAFVAPKSKITTASAEASPGAQATEGFTMPEVVEGRIDNLILSIAAYSDEHSPAVIDCSRLARVDFNAAGRLLTGLAPFCGVGKSIEFHHVNHLVVELFNVIGLKDIVRIVPRKN
jgi:ABC-type transporter Mla MlaB component